MKNKLCFTFALLLFAGITGSAQIFDRIYPVNENPNINFRTDMVKSETILFEAKPAVKYSFINNILENFRNNGNSGFALYVAYKPQLRMYTDSSVPVKMPSYRIELGAQYVHRIGRYNLLTLCVESGHYSNGQSGCTFNPNFKDGSHQSDSVIASITPKSNLSQMLNRVDGEFSTDLTEVVVNYKINPARAIVSNMPYETHSFKLGFNYYHKKFLGIANFGGYADNLIGIYGHWRFMGSYEFLKTFKTNRISISENLEIIKGAHPSVNPMRLEMTFCDFFWKNFGLFASFITGHDDYNIRFVDSGNQFSIGVVWNGSPPFKL